MSVASAYLLGGANPIPLLPGMIFTFGRGRQNTVILKDALVSRQHAILTCDDTGGISIMDMGSSNETFVNDEAIAPNQKVNLNHDDKIRIGGSVFYIVLKAEAAEQKLDQKKIPTSPNVGTRFNVADGIVITQGAASGRQAHSTNSTQRLDPVTDASLDEPPALAGQLSVQNLPQVLQFLHHNTSTGELLVKTPIREGLLLFEKGKIFSARSGDLAGEEAIYALALLWQGSFQFTDTPHRPAGKADVAESMMQIVFECCRRFDDEAHK